MASKRRTSCIPTRWRRIFLIFRRRIVIDVVLANPPFGGKERAEVQQNFPIKTGETAFLFLQHFIKILKAGGRAGVVIKNTFLSNTDNASVSLRKNCFWKAATCTRCWTCLAGRSRARA